MVAGARRPGSGASVGGRRAAHSRRARGIEDRPDLAAHCSGPGGLLLSKSNKNRSGPPLPSDPDAEAPTADRARRRRRFWRRLALGTALALGSCAGGVAWVLPDGKLAEDARAGGVGEALDEALRRGDAEPLADYLRRVPGTRVCFAREYRSLSAPPWRAYWRTYGLPDLAVPDAHWAIAVLRSGMLPEFAVAPTQRLILGGDLGCAGAGRLRLNLENRPGRPSLLNMSAEP